MTTVKQISVFLSNHYGSMESVLSVFKEAGVQLIATTVADTTDYGIFRVICDKPETAAEALKAAGMQVTTSELFAVELNDVPGAALEAISAITAAGMNIMYLYSFILDGKGVLIFKTDDMAKASAVIEAKGLKTRAI